MPAVWRYAARAVRPDRDMLVSLQSHRGLRRLKSHFASKMSVGAQMVAVL